MPGYAIVYVAMEPYPASGLRTATMSTMNKTSLICTITYFLSLLGKGFEVTPDMRDLLTPGF